MTTRLSANDIVRQIYDLEYVINWDAVRHAFGVHRSKKIGAGFRFGGVRPQDAWPAGRINERASEIFDEPYVTVWRTSRQIRAYVLDDLSGSMDFGSHPSKNERAARIDAAIAYSASRNYDLFTYIGFAEQVEIEIHSGEAGRGKDLLWLVADSRLKFKSGRKSAAGFSKALSRLPQSEPALVFVLSDFLPQEAFLPHLAAVIETHDIVPVVLRDVLEKQLPDEGGYAALIDTETGEEVLVPLDAGIELANEDERLTKAFGRLGLAPVWRLPGEDDLLCLIKYFLRRQANAV
jgi:uncharacterized protein (DUF58 family)